MTRRWVDRNEGRKGKWHNGKEKVPWGTIRGKEVLVVCNALERWGGIAGEIAWEIADNHSEKLLSMMKIKTGRMRLGYVLRILDCLAILLHLPFKKEKS